MKMILLIYLTIGMVFVIGWCIVAIWYNKKAKKILKNDIFWFEVLTIAFLWPLAVGFRLYLLYQLYNGYLDGQEMVDDIHNELMEDSE